MGLQISCPLFRQIEELVCNHRKLVCSFCSAEPQLIGTRGENSTREEIDKDYSQFDGIPKIVL